MKILVAVLFSFLAVSSLALILNPVDSQLPPTPPPTPAFRYFFDILGNNVTAFNYSSHTTFVPGSGISILNDYLANTITITATGSGTGNATILKDLGDVDFKGPPVLNNVLFFNGTQWTNGTVVAAGDNLGNHIATQFLDLDTNFLSMERNVTTVPIPSVNSLNIFVENTATRPILKATGETGITYELSGDTISVCRNTSGSGMVKGDLVYVTGGNLNRVIVSLARANSESTLPVFGVLLEDIADSSNGLCLNSGLLKYYDTTGTPFGETWNEGDILWISATTAGDFTNVKPTVPTNYPQRVGIVINKNANNGVIYFNPVTIRANFEGTNVNDWSVGNDAAGTKTLTFHNGFDYQIAATPSDNRLAVLPDKSGTFAFTDDIVPGALDDLTDVTITTPAYNHIIQYKSGLWLNKLFALNTQSPDNDFQIIGINNQTGVITRNQFSVNTITCGGSDFVKTINNVSGQITCATPAGGAIDIIQEGNSNVEVIDGGTGQVDIDIDGTNEFQFFTNLFDVLGATIDNVAIFISNAADPADGGVIRLGNAETIAWEQSPAGTDLTITADATENFVWDSIWNNINFGSNPFINAVFDVAGTGNRLTSTGIAVGDILRGDGTDFKRLARGSANQVLKVNAGGTDIEWGTDATGGSGGPTILGADVTCTATATYCTVWTIPLTASSGNALDVYMIGDSNTAGSAIQMRVQFDNAGNQGFCTYRTYTTATAEVLDVLAATAATDTGETVWLAGANIPMPLRIQCGFETDASPGNALVQIQMEVASTGTIQKGSYYVKTP